MKHKTNPLWECSQVSIQYCAVVGLLLLSMTAWTPAQADPQIAERALAATVYLTAEKSNGDISLGSGFFVDNNLIATSFHVIEGAVQVTARLVNKSEEYTIQGITTKDEKNDLAILKVMPTPLDSQPLSLGDSDTVKIGETVYVVGNPKGLEGTFTKGIISRVQRSTFQMDASISPGSSGGPVLNDKSEVIAVSRAVTGVSFSSLISYLMKYGIFTVPQNLNFAVPSNHLKALLKQVGPTEPSSSELLVSARTHFRQGFRKLMSREYNAAIADYDQAIRLKPEFAEAYNVRGHAKSFLARYDSAIADYNQAIRLLPEFTDPELSMGKVKGYQVETYYYRGHAKYFLARYDSAIADYDQAIRLSPEFAGPYYYRGHAKYSLARYDSAIADYDQAIRLSPEFAEAYYARGRANYSLAQYNLAIADYDQAIRLSPEFAEAYYARGRANYSLAQYNLAIADYDQAIRLKPKFAKAYIGRYEANLKLHKVSEALDDLGAAGIRAVFPPFPTLPPE